MKKLILMFVLCAVTAGAADYLCFTMEREAYGWIAYFGMREGVQIGAKPSEILDMESGTQKFWAVPVDETAKTKLNSNELSSVVDVVEVNGLKTPTMAVKPLVWGM